MTTTRTPKSYVTWRPNQDVVNFFYLLKKRKIAAPPGNRDDPIRIGNDPPPGPDDPLAYRPDIEITASESDTDASNAGWSEEHSNGKSAGTQSLHEVNPQKKRRKLEKRLRHARL